MLAQSTKANRDLDFTVCHAPLKYANHSHITLKESLLFGGVNAIYFLDNMDFRSNKISIAIHVFEIPQFIAS